MEIEFVAGFVLTPLTLAVSHRPRTTTQRVRVEEGLIGRK